MAGRRRGTNNLLRMPHFMGWESSCGRGDFKSPEKLAALPMLRLVSLGTDAVRLFGTVPSCCCRFPLSRGPHAKFKSFRHHCRKNNQGRLKNTNPHEGPHACGFPGSAAPCSGLNRRQRPFRREDARVPTGLATFCLSSQPLRHFPISAALGGPLHRPAPAFVSQGLF